MSRKLTFALLGVLALLALSGCRRPHRWLPHPHPPHPHLVAPQVEAPLPAQLPPG